MKRLIVLAMLAIFSSASLASHCPSDAKAIDAAMTKVSLTDDQKAQITALRDQGMAQHEAGDHAAAEKSLAEAMRMLLNSL